MTAEVEDAKRAELDRLLNDPEVPMQPDRVWSLLAELASIEPAAPVGASRPV